jgi:hypothetical protein
VAPRRRREYGDVEVGIVSRPLRVVAGAKLHHRELPPDRPITTAVGVGDSLRPCGLCTHAIDGPIEIRVRLADTTLAFHGHCHHLWLMEWERLKGA